MSSVMHVIWLVLGSASIAAIAGEWVLRRRRQPKRTLGDIFELQLRLAEGEQLAVKNVWWRRGHQRVELDLDGVRLEAWCYWPVRVRPLQLWSVRWIEKVGWGLDVQTDTGPARLYAWHLRCGAAA